MAAVFTENAVAVQSIVLLFGHNNSIVFRQKVKIVFLECEAVEHNKFCAVRHFDQGVGIAAWYSFFHNISVAGIIHLKFPYASFLGKNRSTVLVFPFLRKAEFGIKVDDLVVGIQIDRITVVLLVF